MKPYRISSVLCIPCCDPNRLATVAAGSNLHSPAVLGGPDHQCRPGESEDQAKGMQYVRSLVAPPTLSRPPPALPARLFPSTQKTRLPVGRWSLVAVVAHSAGVVGRLSEGTLKLLESGLEGLLLNRNERCGRRQGAEFCSCASRPRTITSLQQRFDSETYTPVSVFFLFSTLAKPPSATA